MNRLLCGLAIYQDTKPRFNIIVESRLIRIEISRYLRKNPIDVFETPKMGLSYPLYRQLSTGLCYYENYLAVKLLS
jgi:hypothetical protein